MSEQTYIYDYPTGGFAWNAYNRKVHQAIGRIPVGTATVQGGTKIAIRFDPPLDAGEEAAVAAIFADPETAARVPTDREAFVIIDAFDSDFVPNLSAAITAVHGNPCTADIMFYRGDESTPEGRTDRIALIFDRDLTVQETKAANTAINALLVGWTTVVEV